MTTKALPHCLHEIARKAGFDTLETRKSDSLDFHDMAVWDFRAALMAAYEAGRASVTTTTKRSSRKASRRVS